MTGMAENNRGIARISGKCRAAAVRLTINLQTVLVLLLLGMTSLPSPASSTDGAVAWSVTASMHVPRIDHTATLLADGRVLITGGWDGHHVLASAEVYNPQTDTWTLTGSMHTPRMLHTATLLPNGSVLVAGGRNELDLASAEVYDPRTGTWARTAAMHTPRSWHTATLLPTGSVLVAGGCNMCASLNSAELYNPQTRHWAPTGSMHDPRKRHTATLLPTGQVLVVGGDDLGTSTEVYDPQTGQWARVMGLRGYRDMHTATLLPTGTVLVVGGLDPQCSSHCFAPASNVVDMYDPASRTWTEAPLMNDGRMGHTATLLTTGQVLVAGGGNGQDRGGEGQTEMALASTELYDWRANTWLPAAPLHTARRGQTATLLPSGHVLVVGGETGTDLASHSVVVSGAELYNSPPLTIFPAQGHVGRAIIVTGTAWPNDRVSLYWDTTHAPGLLLSRIQSSSSGMFTTRISIPTSNQGVHTIIAIGQRSHARTRATFTVNM